jgi:hypothetical protein
MDTDLPRRDWRAPPGPRQVQGDLHPLNAASLDAVGRDPMLKFDVAAVVAAVKSPLQLVALIAVLGFLLACLIFVVLNPPALPFRNGQPISKEPAPVAAPRSGVGSRARATAWAV